VLAGSILEWITEDIIKAKNPLEEANEMPGDKQAEPHSIFEVVDKVKGQGGSFSYHLLTKIGGSLCNYLRAEQASACDRHLKVIAAHFAA